MIFWSGLGFLVPVVGFGLCLATEILVELAFNDPKYYQSHGWPKLVALSFAGIITWLLSRYLCSKSGKRYLDLENDQEVVLNWPHTFMFIPINYWGPIFFILAIVFAFIE